MTTNDPSPANPQRDNYDPNTSVVEDVGKTVDEAFGESQRLVHVIRDDGDTVMLLLVK